MIVLKHIDHVVFTVADIERSCTFYEKLGMNRVQFGDGRVALQFGQCKINLHAESKPFAPHARNPITGSADICLISETPVEQIMRLLKNEDITIETGPVERTGARMSLTSIYLRDPDGNLIEIANEQAQPND